MKIISVLVVCGLSVAYGEHMNFKLDESGVCELESQNKAENVIFVAEGDTVRVDVHSTCRINNAICSVENQTKSPIPTPPEFKQKRDGLYLNFQNVSKNLSGRWKCIVEWNSMNGSLLQSDCAVDVKITENHNVIIIACVVVIVFLVIVGQTIALLYFRKRAQVQKRMENLQNARKPLDGSDEARYSGPPSRRSANSNRANADTNSHLYEMIGFNEMYNEGSHRGKITDIKDRPRLPLPGEAYEDPAAMDTLPLPKPVVQIDDPLSLHGSLQRPPKPIKTGSRQKNMANDPAIIELKKVLEKRTIVESSLPKTSTPTEKIILPIPAKKTLPEKPKKAVGMIQPLTPPGPETNTPASNSMNSTLKAKLEAAFKSKTEPPMSTLPARLPQTPKPVLPAVLSPKTGPELPYRPLPPIHLDDLNLEDDDEFWTYEPLEKFNIYNI